ncbi:hypothetical protein PYCCODRAFT_1442690 [Trametes coccinea BRFM310]|uniref:Uncharacterized protein n=1 Tax=Trametes coccinea (strain BRFM310) TaxID=1353009 RepID=A0A1Y2J280_TRAC3|nr:hypothetical protein PYCCODRAFT_1442690 [Trametes coccinea BRFM310]
MDNTSSNDTMMVELESVLLEEGIPFDHDGNRIRDPVQQVRDLVTALRQSGQRRNELQQFIAQGVAVGRWNHLPQGEQIKPLQLLRDCETRWSSTFLMLDRVLLLYPAISDFLAHPSRADLTKHLLSAHQLAVLTDIYRIFEVPHQVQQLVSAEKTPTLSYVLPAYELLVDAWKSLRQALPPLKHYLDLGIAKIEEYINKSRKSRVYALAMEYMAYLT